MNKQRNPIQQTSAVPNRIFELLKKSNVVKFMKACKEVNIAFIPYEQQVNFLVLFCFVLFGLIFGYVYLRFFPLFIILCVVLQLQPF